MKLRWRLLPLHAASIFRAHKEAFMALLVANPKGAAFSNDQGMLPLYLYLKGRTGDAGVDEEVVSILAKAYPEGAQIKDNAGRTPLDFVERSLLRCLGVEPEVKKVQRRPRQISQKHLQQEPWRNLLQVRSWEALHKF